MKKNRMMRLASVLLVLTLLTTSMISGTFAKYVTSETVTDSARVAKWGVGITTYGTLFAEQYQDAPITDATDSSITVQVNQSSKEDVVAPGTRNDEGITFTLTGQPEVDLKLDVVVEATDIVLPAGTYDDPTKGNEATDDFSLSSDYHPLVFTLKNGTGKTLFEGTLAALKTYLESFTTAKIDSNTNLNENFAGTGSYASNKTDGTYKLTWAWAYGDATGVSENDRADTLLGNIAAGTTTVTGASTKVSFKITITATQID